MFPDISCDDIFRLETARLWLRWLRVGDVAAVVALPNARSVLVDEADDPHHPVPGELHPGNVDRLILEARKATAAGAALVLGATSKAKNRALVGVLAARARTRGDLELRCAFAPTAAGASFAIEGLAALAEACFNLTDARQLIATSDADGSDTHQVLAAIGFSGVSGASALQIQRRDWLRARSQRLPDMSHQGERREGHGRAGEPEEIA